MSVQSSQPRDIAQTYDIEVEQAFLGCCIINQSLIQLATPHIQPDDLHEGIHSAIFELMIEQDMAGKVITPLTLSAWLKHDARFEEVGGVLSYLSELALGAPVKSAIEDTAKILARMSLRRRGIAAIDDAKESLYAGKDISSALADVVVTADEISARQAESQDGTHMAGDLTYGLLRDIERQAVSELAFSCKTGLHELDDILGGLVPGNLIVIGGRPGMGKTIVGCELALAAARAGWEPDYFSLEMPGRELGARMVSSIDYETAVREGRPVVEYRKLIQLSATREELSRAAKAQLILRELPIEIFDFEDITMARIAAIARARASKAARRDARKLTIIDHLGLIEPDERYRGRKVDELTLITKRSKQLAKRTNQPIVLLAQLNREVEGRDDKRPRISDFRDSGSIEQDADVLIGLYRHDYYAAQKKRETRNKSQSAQTDAESEALQLNEVLEQEVLKNRNGRTATARCHIKVEVGALRDEAPVKRREADLLRGLISPVTSEGPPAEAYSDELSRGK